MKQIKKYLIFSLSKRNNADKFKAYFITVYLGGNRSQSRILCYSETDAKAIKAFDEVTAKFTSKSEARTFLKENVRKLVKHDNPNYIHYDEIIFKGTLGSKLKSFYDKKNSEPRSKSYKSTVKYVLNKVNEEVVREENLTKELIDRVYNKITQSEAHLSPESIRSYRSILRLLCSYLDLDDRKLLKDFVIHTKKQLKSLNIEVNSKNRRHFERSEIKKLIGQVINEQNPDVKSNIFVQLYFGIRPGDLQNITETKDKIVVVTNKTEAVCVFKKDKFYEAYKLLTDLHIDGLEQSNSSEYFMELTNRLFGTRFDQYCIRHTVISHRVLSGESLKIISQESGHASLRMLDSNYAKKIMNEGDKLEDQIIFKNVLSPNYRHWLIQELLLARWPKLLTGKPKEETYEKVIEILKSNEGQLVGQIDL